MAMVSIKDKYSSQAVPRDRFGNELLVSDGNGDTWGEMTVKVTDGVAADRMLQAYAVAMAEATGDGRGIVDECEEYLAQIRRSEYELEGQHPKFSNVIDGWIQAELAKIHGPEATVSNIDTAHMYSHLYSEVYTDYQEAVEAEDMQAVAEWDVVASIIDKRIEEYTVLDMIDIAKVRYGLAA